MTNQPTTYQFIDQADRPLKKGESYFWKVCFMRNGKTDSYPSRSQVIAMRKSKLFNNHKGLEDERGNRKTAEHLSDQGHDVALVRTIGSYL